jgi:chaperonin GroES
MSKDTTKKTLTPLGDRVIIRRASNEEKSPGGIIIPDVAKEKPVEGTVVAVGPGTFRGDRFVETTVKAGQKVLFGKYSGNEVRLNGEEVVVVREDDILGVLE